MGSHLVQQRRIGSLLTTSAGLGGVLLNGDNSQLGTPLAQYIHETVIGV